MTPSPTQRVMDGELLDLLVMQARRVESGRRIDVDWFTRMCGLFVAAVPTLQLAGWCRAIEQCMLSPPPTQPFRSHPWALLPFVLSLSLTTTRRFCCET